MKEIEEEPSEEKYTVIAIKRLRYLWFWKEVGQVLFFGIIGYLIGHYLWK